MLNLQIDEELSIHIIGGDKRELFEVELLLQSKDIPYLADFFSFPYELIIEQSFSNTAQQEIKSYFEENQNFPPKENTPSTTFVLPQLLWLPLVVLFFFHKALAEQYSGGIWIENGIVHAQKILQGEWARTFTGLTLHADDAHLFGNIFVLWLFVHGVSQKVGVGFAWLLTLVTGALGNYFNVLFYQDHRSLGASTAVFSALGLVAGLRVKDFWTSSRKSMLFVPIIGAIALFSMLGVDVSTDVMAHFFGLIAGLIGGVCCMFFGEKRIANHYQLQLFFYACFSALIFLTWKFQLD
ncbi:MAG: rhomboid protease GluP [bacterium]|jgi:rhomboid protease GluP